MDRAGTERDGDLLRRLRAGDTAAFGELVATHHASMVRVAGAFVATTSDAEDVAQETWIAVIRGINGFEGRSSLRSWVFAVLVNRAKTYAGRDAGRNQRRFDPPPGHPGHDGDDGVPPDRFVGPPGRGVWRDPVAAWQTDPQLRLDSDQAMKTILAAVADLPPLRRQVLVLRDVEGWDADEVCELLGLSAVNQRVILYRARTALRLRLETEYRR